MAINAQQQKVGLPQKTYTTVEICGWLNVTPSYLKQLTEAGITPNVKNSDGHTIVGRYDLRTAVHGYIDHIMTRVRNKTPTQAQLDEIRLAKQTAEHETIVIRNLVLKGVLVNVEHVNAQVIEMMMAARSKLLGFGAHVARLIEGKEHNEIIRILNEQMERALVDLRPVDFDAVRARDRRLSKFTDVFTSHTYGEDIDQNLAQDPTRSANNNNRDLIRGTPL